MKTSWHDYLLSTLAISLLLLISLLAVSGVQPWSRATLGDYHVLFDLMLGMVVYGLATALLIRTLLRWFPLRAGAYGEQSSEFIYWKLLTVVYRLGQGALRPFVPVFMQPLVELRYGARIGRDVALGGVIDDPFRVSVGDGTALGTASMVCGSFRGGGVVTSGPVRIGKRVTVGPNCVIFPNTELGDGSVLMVGAYLMPAPGRRRAKPGEVSRPASGCRPAPAVPMPLIDAGLPPRLQSAATQRHL